MAVPCRNLIYCRKIANMKQFHHIWTGHPLLREISSWKSTQQVRERSWWRPCRIWDSSSAHRVQVRTFVPAASSYCISGILIVTNSLIGSKNISLTLVLRDLPLIERFKVPPIHQENRKSAFRCFFWGVRFLLDSYAQDRMQVPLGESEDKHLCSKHSSLKYVKWVVMTISQKRDKWIKST